MTATTSAKENLAFLRGLRSTRNFLPDPVPQEVLDDIMQVARWSGSAKNKQPWDFIIVRDRADLRTIGAAEGSASHVAGAALAIVIAMDNEPDREEQEIFDEGKVSERLMLAAHAHGVSSCIGWVKGNGSEEVKALLGIPASRRVRTVLSLGYADPVAQQARPKPVEARKAVYKMVHEGRYAG